MFTPPGKKTLDQPGYYPMDYYYPMGLGYPESWMANPNEMRVHGDSNIFLTQAGHPDPVTLHIMPPSGNGVTSPPPGNHTYDYNTNAHVEAQPDPGYTHYWLKDGQPAGSNPTIDIYMNAPHTVQAIFVPEPAYKFVNSITGYGGDVVNPTGLVGWQNDEDFTAIYSWFGPYPVYGWISGALNAPAAGRIKVYGYGDGPLYVYTSNDGYNWSPFNIISVNIDQGSPSWIDCGIMNDPFNYIKFSAEDLSNYYSIGIDSVRVEPTEFTLAVNVVGSGSVTKNPNQATYTYGTPVQLTAIPGDDWSFSGWSGALSGSTSPITIVMDGDKTVTATFIEDPPSGIIFSDDFSSGNFNAWTSTYGNPTVSAGKAMFTVQTGGGTQCYASKDQLAIDSDTVFSVLTKVSFNTVPTNGQGNSAIFFSAIADFSNNALVYAFVDGSQHFGLWIGEWPNQVMVYDTATVQADTFYDVTIELDNSNQLIKLIVNGQTRITYGYTAYSAFHNSNYVDVVEGIVLNYHWAEVQVKLDEVVITSEA